MVSVPSLFAQDDFASLRKNVNYRAKGLNHDLNSTKDTLLLSSKSKIYRIYTVGDNSGAIDKTINDFSAKIPLNPLDQGKYVFVVDQLNLKIVFQIQIMRDYQLEQVVANHDETEIQDTQPSEALAEIDDEEQSSIVEQESDNEGASEILDTQVQTESNDKSQEEILEEKLDEQRLMIRQYKEEKRRNMSVSKLLSIRSSKEFDEEVPSKDRLSRFKRKQKTKRNGDSRAYNITELDRVGMQTREEARVERVLQESSNKSSGLRKKGVN